MALPMGDAASKLAELTEAPSMPRGRKPFGERLNTKQVMDAVARFGRGVSKKRPETQYNSRTWHQHYTPVKRNTRLHYQGLDEAGQPIWA